RRVLALACGIESPHVGSVKRGKRRRGLPEGTHLAQRGSADLDRGAPSRPLGRGECPTSSGRVACVPSLSGVPEAFSVRVERHTVFTFSAPGCHKRGSPQTVETL